MKGWEVKPLKDVCSILSGLWKGKKGPYQTATVIRNTNFSKDCRLDLEDVAVIEVEARQLTKRRLVPGDLILEKSGGGPKQPVGRIVYFNEPDGVYSYSNFTSVLRINYPSAISPLYLQRYLFWQYMTGVTEGMQRQSTGIRNLDMTAYMAIPVRYPPLPEQHRIVAILDEVFEGIAAAKASAETNLRNTKEVFRASVAGAFRDRDKDWVDTTVELLSENLDSKRIPITKSERQAGDFPYYGASGIVDYVKGHIFEGDCLLVSEDGANLLMRSTPIAFSVSGKYWVNNHAHVLRFPEMVTQKYVEFYLESIALNAYITGAAQPKLTQRALNTIPIPVPRQVAQRQRIVDLITSMDLHTVAAANVFSTKITALDELKASLLHQAFTGQL
jgi:type I restriction enzyme S subunit